MIETVNTQALQPEFAALLDAVRTRLRALLGPQLDSVYIYGSVARGLARPGHSDLDLSLVVTQALTLQQTQQLDALAQQCLVEHGQVSKIDFDIGLRSDVLDPQNLFSWGYWLKHECRCIDGQDLSAHFPLFAPSVAIAQALNGDYVQVLDAYRVKIAAARNLPELRKWQKEAARKWLRAGNLLRSASDTHWPRSLPDYAHSLCLQYPDRAAIAGYFLRQASEPDASGADFNAQLQAAVQWLQQTLARRGLARGA